MKANFWPYGPYAYPGGERNSTIESSIHYAEPFFFRLLPNKEPKNVKKCCSNSFSVYE